MGIEDIFNEPAAQQPEEQPVIEQKPEEIVQQPAEELPAPVTQEQPQPAAPQEEKPQHVPLATFLDQRDELKRWRQEAEQLRAAQTKPQAPQNAPDPFDDPEGFRASIQSQMEQQAVQTRFQVSDTIARQQHGAETVEAAGAWAAARAEKDPGFAVAYMQQNHPIDWIVQQHKRDQLMSQIGDDPDEWVRRRYAELNPAPAPSAAPVAVPAQPAPAPVPPRSLASAPSQGGVKEVPVGPNASLSAVFSR